jgi:transposase
VAWSIATKSGRAMIEALTGGERRGPVLAQLAKGTMRAKIADLPMALEGRFGDHHTLMCRLQLDHIDQQEAAIARLDARIEQMMEPFQCWPDLLATIPGIGRHAAAAVISEIGVAVGVATGCSGELFSAERTPARAPSDGPQGGASTGVRQR